MTSLAAHGRSQSRAAASSRDIERLRDWLNDERRLRRDLMTSQHLLQRTLMDCLRTANQQLLAARTVRLIPGPVCSDHRHYEMLL